MTDSGSDNHATKELIQYIKTEIDRLYTKLDNLCNENNRGHKELRERIEKSSDNIQNDINRIDKKHESHYNELHQKVEEVRKDLDNHLNEHKSEEKLQTRKKLVSMDNDAKKWVAVVTSIASISGATIAVIVGYLLNNYFA